MARSGARWFHIADKHLNCVLIRSDLGLPRECEDAGAKRNGVVDFHVLLVVDRVGESVDSPRLEKSSGARETI